MIYTIQLLAQHNQEEMYPQLKTSSIAAPALSLSVSPMPPACTAGDYDGNFCWDCTLSLTGSWPPSISLLEACSGPLKRATLAEKRLFWWRHCRSYKASGSEERAISTNFPPFPLNRVHRSLGTSTGGLFRPTGKGEGTTIGGGGGENRVT